MERLTGLRTRGPVELAAPAAPGSLLDVGLVLTHACNLACAYCYTGEKKRVRMPEAVAMQAVESAIAVARAAQAKLQLTFFGGEPLLEAQLLLDIAARARSLADGLPFVMQVTTNGTLLDAALVEQLGALGVHLAISIDGTRAQHEAARPLAGGGSSWETTRRGLDLLLAARDRFSFDVVAVVDPGTVHLLGDGVRELLDLGVDAITLNANFGGVWGEPELAVLEQQLEVVAALVVAWLRRGRWVGVQPLESALRSFAEIGRVVTASCGAGSRRLAVAPSGRIYGCCRAVGEDTGKGALGHLDDGLPGPQAGGAGCACANAEETGDPRVAGAVQLRHDRAVQRVGLRLATLLCAEYELLHIVERGPCP